MNNADTASLRALFDHPPDRRGTASTKWSRYADRDVLPFWVADMEFPAPPAVREALRARIDHGIFGYSQIPRGLTDSVLSFLAERYGWQVDPTWLVWLPGVMPGVTRACHAVGRPGDAVMTAVPIYYPFLNAPGNADRVRVDTHLVRRGPRWEMDFDALEATLSATPSTRLFLLCNPQNPTGRAYTRTELERLAALAERFDLIIASDEIHAELVLDPALAHHPIAHSVPEIAARTITFMAPTKTFNLAGLSSAYAIIPDARLRERYREAGAGLVSSLGPLPLIAAEAAYRHGEPWRAVLLDVLRENRDRLEQAVAAMPGLEMTHVEATCLGWIDARALGVENPHALFEAAGVGLSPGAQFGSPGFVRFNFGCSPSLLEAGLARMQQAVATLDGGAVS